MKGDTIYNEKIIKLPGKRNLGNERTRIKTVYYG